MATATDGSTGRPRVAVLLSLYNGEKYLAEQLESLARQRDVRVHVIARDDGSRDNSAQACEEICQHLGLSCKVERGPNLGVVGSFQDLLYRDLSAFDFVAPCDQDDVWRDDKLIRAVIALEPLGSEPAVYCTAHTIADEHLQELGVSPSPRAAAFGNALIENIVQGASAVLNRAGIELLQDIGRPSWMPMHDWWFYLVFSALGRVVFDPHPSLLYRQHGANVVGGRRSPFRHWLVRIQRHFQNDRDAFYRQAEEFDRLAGSRLPPQHRQLLQKLLASRRGLGARVRLATDRSLWRQRPIDDVIFRLLLLMGRY